MKFLRTTFFFSNLSLFFSLLHPLSARAELTPEQLGVLVNKQSKESVELGRYYLEQRKIPAAQLFEIDVPIADTLSRSDYEQQVVIPLRRQLQQKGLSAKIRAFVSIYGVPLRVAAPEAQDEDKQVLLEALSFRDKARKELQTIAKSAAELGSFELIEPKNLEEETDEVLVKRVQAAVAQAVNTLYNAGDAEKNREYRTKLNELISRYGGVSAISQAVKIPPNSGNVQAEQTLEKLKKDVQSAYQLLKALDESRTTLSRKRAYTLTAQAFGASGLLTRANGFKQLLEFKEADASIDSELGFLWWDRSQYMLAGRIPSPFHHRFLKQNQAQAVLLPILFASRLDAPKPEQVRKLIDMSIASEAKGPVGNAYIDARGMKAEAMSFGLYDEGLRVLARLLEKKTSFDVELNNKEERFSKPGEAPEVALYAGWYRLRNYEDAFTFNPGSIGYHIASEEAVSLHDPEEKGWCKNALERGIAATLGAIGEPYLDSFPLPQEFFGLLLSGKYSLLEAYVLTSPFLSWRMVLLGDPLYKPFGKNPLVEGKDLAELGDTQKTLDPLPASPFDQAQSDPLQARQGLAKRKEQLEKELDVFYKALDERLKEQQKAAKTAPAVKPAEKK